MPKGVYIRTEAQKENLRTRNIGREPWNKGKRDCQVAWNEGLQGYITGTANPRWRDGLTKRERDVLTAKRQPPARCEVCYENSSLDFDHCHTDNHFRGWICRRCNLVLGMVKDRPVLLRNLAQYLDNNYDGSRPRRLIDALLIHDGNEETQQA